MIELYISPRCQSHQNIKEKLEEMSLARKIVESEIIQVPLLKHAGESYEDQEEINWYIEDLRKLRKQWYACTCD